MSASLATTDEANGQKMPAVDEVDLMDMVDFEKKRGRCQIHVFPSGPPVNSVS